MAEIFKEIYKSINALVPNTQTLQPGKSYILSNDNGSTGINFYRQDSGLPEKGIVLHFTEHTKHTWECHNIENWPIDNQFSVVVFSVDCTARGISHMASTPDSFKWAHHTDDIEHENSVVINKLLGSWLKDLVQQGYKPIPISDLLKDDGPKTLLRTFLNQVKLPKVGKKVDELYSFFKR